MKHPWYTSALMFLWLTIGFAVVHVAICSWAVSLWHVISPDQTPAEHLAILDDGEPLIVTWSWADQRGTYRRLDGTLVDNISDEQFRSLNPATFSTTPSVESANWAYRITPLQDFQTAPTYWYHVAPPTRLGTSYFEGFDKLTRRRVGYLGPNGFSTRQPDMNESFAIQPRRFLASSGVVTATQGLSHEATEPYYGASSFPNAPVDAVWLLSNDTIYEIRLRTRKVRSIFKSDSKLLYLTQVTGGPKSNLKLVLRTSDEILLLDPESLEIESLKVPLPPLAIAEHLYLTSTGQRIYEQTALNVNEWQRLQKHDLTWFDEKGAVERTASVELHPYRNGALVDSLPLSCPVPIVSVGACFIAPFVVPSLANEGVTPSEKIASFASNVRYWLITSIVAGLIAGWDCRRRERLQGHNGWIWPVVVAFAGWFGWISYICLRPLPARLPNLHWMPSQPDPNRPLGTEIFA